LAEVVILSQVVVIFSDTVHVQLLAAALAIVILFNGLELLVRKYKYPLNCQAFKA
jgi:hypothetical protein